jgi:phosphoenolpyruvate carboxykinase (ATP)
MEGDKLNLFYRVANKVYSNLSVAELYEHTILKGLGVISKDGALIVDTRPYTGRSPKDKFIVFDDYTKDLVWWGEVNQPLDRNVFDNLLTKAVKYIQDNKIELYEMDVYAGANPYYTVSIKLLTESPYHAIFTNNLFIRLNELNPAKIVNKVTILHLPNLKLEGSKRWC